MMDTELFVKNDPCSYKQWHPAYKWLITKRYLIADYTIAAYETVHCHVYFNTFCTSCHFFFYLPGNMLPVLNLVMANPVLLNETSTLVPLSYEARSWIMQKDL